MARHAKPVWRPSQWRLARLAVAAGLLLFVTACLDLGHPVAIGVMRSPDGQSLLLAYKPCHAAGTISRVEVEALGEDRTSAGTVVWQVEDASGALTRDFEVGRAPEGFRTLTNERIPATGWIRVTFFTSELPKGDGVEFDLAAVTTAGLRVGDQTMTHAQFESRDTCG